jgi:hypothetical protein
MIQMLFINFYQQTGDFFYNKEIDFLSYLLQFLAISIPLFLFYLSTKSENKKENDQKKNKIIDNIEYFKKLIENVIKTSNKQLKYNHDFIKNIENNQYLLTKLRVMADRDTHRLCNLINQEEYYHSFLNFYEDKIDKDKSIVIFMTLYKNLDLLDSLSKLINKYADTYGNYLIKLHNQIKIKFEDLLKLVELYIFNKPTDINNDLILFLNQHYNHYFNDKRNPERKTELILIEFIEPIIEKFNRENWLTDLKNISLFQHTQELQFMIGEIREFSENTIKEFKEQYIDIMAKSLFDLEIISLNILFISKKEINLEDLEKLIIDLNENEIIKGN